MKSNGVARVLQTQCGICAAFDPNTAPATQRPNYEMFTGIWDTGATGSVITQDVVTRCGLKPTGMVLSHHAGGSAMTETYQVNIQLPNGVQFADFKVTLGVLPHGAHALIGMDIISLGDFNITNVGGKTMFSYRNPTLGGVDYVDEANRMQQIPKRSSGPGGFSGGRQKGRRHKKGR
jgi:hypothetical protein